MIRTTWIINLMVMLLVTSTCDAFVKGWVWNEYLTGYYCEGIPIPQNIFNHLGITWEHYVVEKNDWEVDDLPGFEVCLPQQGMRVFYCKTFKSGQPVLSRIKTDKDNDVSFFVMGLHGLCTPESLRSSGTLYIWTSRQFQLDQGSIANREYLEKLASKYIHPDNDVYLEDWPQPKIEISLFINTGPMVFKVLVHKNGTVYQLSSCMPNLEHRIFFLESFQLH